MPGVRLILTGDDVQDAGLLPMQAGIPDVEIPVPPYPVLARGEVRHVGDAVAFVVADTLEQAKDAAEAVDVQWEALPHMVGAAAALEPGAVQVWPNRPGNLAFEVTLGERGSAADALARAPRHVSLTLVNQRLVTNYLDTRGVVADYDAVRGLVTLTLGSQGSHPIRDTLCEMLRLPPEKIRVVTPDVGGGFGTKLFIYREYVLALLAARELKQPVAWIAERTEHFLGDAQGRDNITTARLAFDDNGRFLALDIDLIADMGAYLSAYAPYIPFLGAGMSPGVYDIPHCFARVRGVYTHTVPVDAYRGAGRPEAAYVIERLVDAAARELDVAPDVLRRRNFIKPKAMPFTTAVGKVYDSGEFASHMARAQELADWAGFRKRAAASRKQGLLRGIGLATYIEACGSMGPDTATVILERDGSVTALMGSQSTGQGHATAYAQIVAEHLGLLPERVQVMQGDTDRIETGTGTGGSSSIPCGGASLTGAAKALALNLKRLAADALEAGAGDLEIVEGMVRVAGTDRAIAFADLAKRPDVTPEMLTAKDVHAAGADLSQRHAHRGGRDRRGHRGDADRQLRGGGRFRCPAQSVAARRAGARRRGAGHRSGADGADGL
jgi:carbon-monoxide dehydrogenase large subunit